MTPSIVERVDELFPQLIDDLCALAAVPSIAFPGFPAEPVRAAHDLVVGLLTDLGVTGIRTLELADTAPAILADIPGPSGAPTVLLYAHYDVQPPGDVSLWRTPPFTPTRVDGTIYGRGVADDKANLIAHLGALRVFGGRPSVGIRIVFEGQEEYGSILDEYPLQSPQDVAADAMLICDMGNIRPGQPTFTTALRGVVEAYVQVRTLAGAKHSGEWGGAAPDALTVLLHALASLHDEHGDVAVTGLLREPWTGEAFTEAEFRAGAQVCDGVPLMGTGGLGERLWSGPAITVLGIDVPSVAEAPSAVHPFARAKVSLRVHPRQASDEALQLLVDHLRAQRPFGVPLTVTPGDVGAGFWATTDGPAYAAARAALTTAWGRDPVQMASGGSIPLVHALARAAPAAEILLFGAEDALSNLHAPNERVLLDELRRTVVAIAEFFERFAASHSMTNPAGG